MKFLEQWGKKQRLALAQVWLDVLLVAGRDLGVWHGDEDHVRQFHRFTGVINFEAFFFGDIAALAARIQTDDDFNAAFLEVQSVSMALRAEADHGADFAFEWRQAGVLFSVDFSGHVLGRVWFEGAQSGSTGWNGQG